MLYEVITRRHRRGGGVDVALLEGEAVAGEGEGGRLAVVHDLDRADRRAARRITVRRAGVEGVLDRITSYNVCYTKLLRAFFKYGSLRRQPCCLRTDIGRNRKGKHLTRPRLNQEGRIC